MPAATSVNEASPEAIVAIRKGRKFSQSALAAAAGIDRTQLWRIETGKAQPYRYTLEQLAKHLEVPVSALLK